MPSMRSAAGRTSQFHLRLLTASAATLLLPHVASAQSTPSAPQDRSDPIQATSNETVKTVQNGQEAIIVTARHYVPGGSITASKADIPLIATPQSVTVITRDQIDLLNFIDAQQAVRYTAGVTGENYGPDLRYDFITVRGFTPRQFVDGLAAPNTTTIASTGVDLYAFESLEILKGPASVLYGTAPPGGIYNEVSRRPSFETGGELQAKYGMYDYKEIEGTITGALADPLAVRLTGLYLDRDAERRDVNAKRLLVDPSATLKIGSRTTLTGLFYYQHDRIDGDTNGFLPVDGTLLPNPLGKIGHRANYGEPDYNSYVRNQYGAGYDLVHEFSDDLAFHSNTKWSRYRETSRVIYGGFLAADNRTLTRYDFPYQEVVHSFATDNRFDARLTTGSLTHKLLVGVDYRRVLNVAAYGFAVATPIDLFTPVYSGTTVGVPIDSPYSDTRLKQTGIYGQDQIGLGKLYLLLGGRYDWSRLDNYLPTAGPDPTSKEHKFTYRVGLNYVTDSGIAPYVGYATSFEPLLGTDSVSGRPFRPTSGKQIEGGIKYDARALGPYVRLFATVAGFRIVQNNVVTTGTSITQVFGTQSGQVKVYGGEAEVVARLYDQLSINASYSYTHSEITRDANNPLDIGSPLPVTPHHKVSMFVDYTLKTGLVRGLGFGGGLRYFARSAGSLPGPFNQIVYFGQDPVLFDAIVHYDTPGWRFAVNGSNIFDKRYVARCSGPVGCTYGAGAQVIGTVTKKF